MKIRSWGFGSRNHLPTEALASADSLYNVLRRYIGVGLGVAPPLRVEPAWEVGGPFPPLSNRVMFATGETELIISF